MDVDSFLILADALPEALLFFDKNGIVLAANRKALNFLNVGAKDLKDRRLTEFLSNTEDELRQAMRFWSRSRTPIPATIRWKHVPKQEHATIQCQAFLLKPGNTDSDSCLALRCVIGRPVSRHFAEVNAELKRQQTLLRKLQASREELERSREHALVTLHSIGDAVITTDVEGRVNYLNPVAEHLTGWKTDEADGRDLAEVFHIIHEITRKTATNPVERCLAERRIVGLANHTTLISRDGTEYVIEDSAAPIRNTRGDIYGVVMVFHDVTDTRLTQRQLEHLANHDTLTGLNNRYYFEQQLEKTVKVVARGRHNAALLYIDLDNFKLVNDSAGHAAGDDLLVGASQRFKARSRQDSVLARLGGDEFGILISDVEQDQLEKIAGRFVDALAGFKFYLNGRSYDVTCSVGIVYIDAEIKLSAEAFRRADIACYVAKQEGRNRCHAYTPDDEQTTSALGEISVINDIRQALDGGSFVLQFQPIRNTTTMQIEKHEVLLRMEQNDGTLIAPGHFIPIAERYGLMHQIDAWVIRRAMKLLLDNWENGSPCALTVNMSGISMADIELMKEIEQFARKNRDIAGHLILEITETAAVIQLDKASVFMKELRKEGIRFALDDFGTGFSSFNYLKHLPVDFIKIDGVFVRDIAHDPVDQAMVRSINSIAHSLGKRTIAEFVENAEILELLKEIGVDFVQGYHVGRPESTLTAHNKSNTKKIMDFPPAMA